MTSVLSIAIMELVVRSKADYIGLTGITDTRIDRNHQLIGEALLIEPHSQ